MLLAIVVQFDFELEQLNVKTTLFHGEFEEKILMEQPQDYEVKKAEDKVCLLQKSIYGLKQSPRQWYKKFNSFMIRVGFLKCKFNSFVYFKKVKFDIVTCLVLYMDVDCSQGQGGDN